MWDIDHSHDDRGEFSQEVQGMTIDCWMLLVGEQELDKTAMSKFHKEFTMKHPLPLHPFPDNAAHFM